MRERAPFQRDINRWFAHQFDAPWLHEFTLAYWYVYFYRIKQFSQFGLHVKWQRMAKSAYYDWKMAMKRNRKPASLQSKEPIFVHLYKVILLTQLPPVEVEFSDKPESGPLTISHLLSQFVLHTFLLALCTLVWVGEICAGALQKWKIQATANTTNAMQPRLRNAEYELESS